MADASVAAVLAGEARFAVIEGDCRDYLPIAADVLVTDPPYGMKWNTDSSRFSGGHRLSVARRGQGRADWGAVGGDGEPFDPAPWLTFKHVCLWGSNHFAERLPVGTTLVWIKRFDPAFGSFLSDAEVAWVKGGHGVYCRRDLTLMGEGANRLHPTQKPVGIMSWAIDRAGGEGVILDPYAGSGSTGVAALRNGRRVILIERDPVHAQTCRERMAAEEQCMSLSAVRAGQVGLFSPTPTPEAPR